MKKEPLTKPQLARRDPDKSWELLAQLEKNVMKLAFALLEPKDFSEMYNMPTSNQGKGNEIKH